MRTIKYAIVDLGSNTIRLSVYHILPDRHDELLFSKKDMAGLVNYISNGVLSESGIERACATLQQFRTILQHFGMEKMYVFATAPLRNIRNTAHAVETIQNTVGVEVDVLPGDLEAQLGYYGALRSVNLKNGALFDIGGGSTELVRINDGKILRAQSLPIGSLNLFKSHVSKIWPKKKEIEEIRAHINAALTEANLPDSKAELICGVGGTARAVLKLSNAWYHRPQNERCLSLKDLKHITQAMLKQDDGIRQLILNLCPDRIHTILPGALLMRAVCHAACSGEIVISRTGVREGYLYQKILHAQK